MIAWAQLRHSYRQTGAFNTLVNLYGFLDDQTFLTKSGEVGVVLAVNGVDDECLDADERDRVARRFEAALRVIPNAAPAWLWSAASHSWIGNGSQAVEEINRARALSPYDPLMYAYNSVAGMAYLADGQFERAVEFGLRSIGENRTYTSSYRLLVLACMLAGRECEAGAHLCQLLKLEPDLTIERYRRRFPGSATPTGQLYCDTLARAGVPLFD